MFGARHRDSFLSSSKCSGTQAEGPCCRRLVARARCIVSDEVLQDKVGGAADPCDFYEGHACKLMLWNKQRRKQCSGLAYPLTPCAGLQVSVDTACGGTRGLRGLTLIKKLILRCVGVSWFYGFRFQGFRFLLCCISVSVYSAWQGPVSARPK